MIPVIDTPTAWTHANTPLLCAAEREASLRGFDLRELMGAGKGPDHIARGRHGTWAALRDHGFSFPEIADLFGVHHSAVMYGVRRAS